MRRAAAGTTIQSGGHGFAELSLVPRGIYLRHQLLDRRAIRAHAWASTERTGHVSLVRDHAGRDRPAGICRPGAIRQHAIPWSRRRALGRILGSGRFACSRRSARKDQPPQLPEGEDEFLPRGGYAQARSLIVARLPGGATRRAPARWERARRKKCTGRRTGSYAMSQSEVGRIASTSS